MNPHSLWAGTALTTGETRQMMPMCIFGTDVVGAFFSRVIIVASLFLWIFVFARIVRWLQSVHERAEEESDSESELSHSDQESNAASKKSKSKLKPFLRKMRHYIPEVLLMMRVDQDGAINVFGKIYLVYLVLISRMN